MTETGHTAKLPANRWRSASPDTVGGLAVWYLIITYRAKYYSANPWRPAWRSDPEPWRSDPHTRAQIRADRQTAKRDGRLAR